MRAVVLSIGIFAILFPIIARSEPINLVCTLDEHMYAIQFDEAATPPSVHWVGITDIELKVVTLDSRAIIADLDMRLSDFPEKSDSASFHINRVTGAIVLFHLRSPTEEEAARKPFGKGDKVILDQETGYCSVRQKAF